MSAGNLRDHELLSDSSARDHNCIPGVHQIWPANTQLAASSTPRHTEQTDRLGGSAGVPSQPHAPDGHPAGGHKRPRQEASWPDAASLPATAADLNTGVHPPPAGKQSDGEQQPPAPKAARATHRSADTTKARDNTASTTAILTTRGSSVVPLLGNVYKGRSGISSNRGIKSNPEVMGDPLAPTVECMKK